ncbi:MAG TPA: hydantoinase/oxoprolinase family protein, partial [Dehalococcoidia bacterium]|nr:hydantoinase/oxoprolinase family protein [Dehalococcoidia bacterium]
LVAFGGAGPLHACDLAAALSMPRVLVPRYPGLLSAIGMALADITRDVSTPLIATLTPAEATQIEARIASAVSGLARRLRADLGAGAEVEPAVDLRYTGQGYELTVPWPGALAGAVQAFHEAHRRCYGHADVSRTVELTLVRARGRLRRDVPPVAGVPEGGPDAAAAFEGRRPVLFGSAEVSAAVYARDRLLAGNVLHGPAVIEQMDSTTLVPPGWTGRVDVAGNLILESETHA